MGMNNINAKSIGVSPLRISFAEFIEHETRKWLQDIFGVSAKRDTEYVAKMMTGQFGPQPIQTGVIDDDALTSGDESKIDLGLYEPKGRAERYQLHGGYTYLIEDDALTEAFDIFICTPPDKLIGQGGGLKVRPEEALELYMAGELSVNWLTTYEENAVPGPLELKKLSDLISRELRKQRGILVLIEGFEQVLLNNKYETIREFIHNLRSIVVETGSIQVISLNPSVIPEVELKLLRQEVDRVI
jgi:hypothetical protein